MLNPFNRSPGLREGIPVLPGAFPWIGHIPTVYHKLPETIRGARAEEGKRLGKRPRLRSKGLPESTFLPKEHPPGGTKVDFVQRRRARQALSS